MHIFVYYTVHKYNLEKKKKTSRHSRQTHRSCESEPIDVESAFRKQQQVRVIESIESMIELLQHSLVGPPQGASSRDFWPWSRPIRSENDSVV